MLQLMDLQQKSASYQVIVGRCLERDCHRVTSHQDHDLQGNLCKDLQELVFGLLSCRSMKHRVSQRQNIIEKC